MEQTQLNHQNTLLPIFKYLFLFLIGGFSYFYLEILYRGFSHFSMIICGGLAFIFCGLINQPYAFPNITSNPDDFIHVYHNRSGICYRIYRKYQNGLACMGLLRSSVQSLRTNLPCLLLYLGWFYPSYAFSWMI